MVTEFQQQIINAIELNQSCNPMHSIYTICKAMGEPQQSSQQKFYVKVYRNMEKLVDMKKACVMRGTRDPSVYLLYSMVKGNDKFGDQEIPF